MMLLAAGSVGAADLFVAPDGRDTNDGTLARPLATLARALELARPLRADGVTIHLRGGTYPLAAGVAIGPEDSGTAARPLRIAAYRDEEPVLVGGRALGGWTPWRDGILRCDLKAQGAGELTFRQLIFAGRRMVRARVPNVDPQDLHGGTWAHVGDLPEPGGRRAFICGRDVDPSRWARPTEGTVHIFPMYDWAWDHRAIAAVDTAERSITLAAATSYELNYGDRYFVDGLLEELDAPGEWYHDAAEGLLYFLPPAPIDQGEVLVTNVGVPLTLKGAQHVELRGLTIDGSDDSGIVLDGATDCAAIGCVIRNTGGWGVNLSGGARCRVVGCDVHHTGRGGILLNGGDRATLTPAGHLVDNCHVHHVGEYERTYNTAVNVGGVGNTVRRCHVHDVPHAGLTLAGNDNLIELCDIHHTNLQSADTGGIYSCPRDWTQRGNTIRWCAWHDIGGFGKANSWQPIQGGQVTFEYPHFIWGIYMDDPTSGNHIYGNLLYRVPVCGLHNHGGRDTVFENNILIDCPALQAGMLAPNWSEWPAVRERYHAVCGPGSPYFARYPALVGYDLDTPEAMTGLVFRRNIVYYTLAGTAWLRGERAAAWGGENRQLLYWFRTRDADRASWTIDDNVIGVPPELSLTIDLSSSPTPAAKLDWDGWRALGHDANSVLADPGFVDPAAGDYRLKPDSPALQRGFEPIPFEQIGCYPSPERARWPLVMDTVGDRVAPVRYGVTLPGYEPLPAMQTVKRGGCGHLFAALAAGRPQTIAYYGGGIHGADGWRRAAREWFAERYPNAPITWIDGSITDAVRGSGFSVYRFAHDVLRHRPDLVIVDYASDDADTPTQAIYAAIEGVLRQGLAANPTLDWLFVYPYREGFDTAYRQAVSPPVVSAYERIAERYDIPTINLGWAVYERIAQGAGLDQFLSGGKVPKPAADALYARALADGLALIAETPVPAARALPRPLARGPLTDCRLAPITPAMLHGDWREPPPDDPNRREQARHFDTIQQTTSPGAALEFRVKARDVSLFWLIGPDTGRIRVLVDGRDVGTRQAVDRWCYYQRLSAVPLAEGLDPNVEHTIRVELLAEPPDRSEPMAEARRLERYREADFQGVALRIGWIRVNGEVLP